MSASGRHSRSASAALALAMLAGCNPVVEISGAFFPAWLLCMLTGVLATALLRWLVKRFNVEPFAGPKAIFYLSTWLASTLGMWLLLYSR